MTEKKATSITRADIGDLIYKEVGIPFNEAVSILESVLDEISDAWTREEDVKISSFGTFSVRQKKERIGRNPKTGVDAVITPRKVVTFKPSQAMKEKVMQGNKK